MSENTMSRAHAASKQTSRLKLTWLMKPSIRKAWLLAHVTISVGWFGGGYAMLIMGIAAMRSAGAPLRPAAYELMHWPPVVGLAARNGQPTQETRTRHFVF